MRTAKDLRIKIYADGADQAGMLEMYSQDFIRGFTTNPTLMRKAGVRDYVTFAKDVLRDITDKPVSFEVFSDDFNEMFRQAMLIASWGENVYVKIPVTNTKKISSYALIHKLSMAGIRQNVTAILTLDQVQETAKALANGPPAYVSVFAGRIADTGRDPLPVMVEALDILRPYPHLELIWASPREVFNVYQADAIGCHIITATNDIIKKLKLSGKDMEELSLETVNMFYNDAAAAGFTLETHAAESYIK